MVEETKKQYLKIDVIEDTFKGKDVLRISTDTLTDEEILELLVNALVFMKRREPMGRSIYKYRQTCPHCDATVFAMLFDADPIFRDDAEDECANCGKMFHITPENTQVLDRNGGVIG